MTLDDYFQAFYQRWWVAALLGPLLFGATIGVALSIYTNWVTSRLMFFAQELQRAREATLAFVDIYRSAILQTDEAHAEAAFQWILFRPVMALSKLQQQGKAAGTVKLLGNTLEQGALRSWRRINQVSGTAAEIPVLEDEIDKLEGAVLDIVARLDRIRPNYWIVFGLPTFGRSWRRFRYRLLRAVAQARTGRGSMPQPLVETCEFVGRRSDCGDCCANCKRVL